MNDVGCKEVTPCRVAWYGRQTPSYNWVVQWILCIGYKKDGKIRGIRFPAKLGTFLYSVSTSCGAHLASHSESTGCPSSMVRGRCMTQITYDYWILKVVKPDAAYQKGQRSQRTAVSDPFFTRL